MSYNVTRRAFHGLCISGLGLGLMPLIEGASNISARSYAVRFHYWGRGKLFQFWTRVRNPSNSSDDVPLTLVLSADKGGQRILRTKTYVARAARSHIVRGRLNLNGISTPSAKSPIYCQMLLGQAGLTTKVVRLPPA
jgi:hypothetical protein